MSAASRVLPDSSISGSGSVQSRLSTTNSQQRLRATNAYATSSKEPSSSVAPVLLKLNHHLSLRALFPFPEMQASTHPQDHHSSSRSWKALALKWIVLVYCFLSFVFTSTVLCNHLHRNDKFRIPAANKLLAPTLVVSLQQRLSGIASPPGIPWAFEPYLLAAPVDLLDITACLWTTDDLNNLHLLHSWVTQWSVSLAMITQTRPRSTMHHALLQRLGALHGLPGFSLHLVHVMNDQHHPSTYLNLARLFATTSTVMLFPADISNVLPARFHNTLIAQISLPVRKPLLISETATSAFTIPGLTPVILPRHYQLWCNEKAFLASRTSEWDDCLWHLWLEEFGLEHANLTVTFATEDPIIGADAAVLTRTRNRLSATYRAELCDLAMKRLWPNAPQMSKSAKRRVQWVKHFCRQTEIVAKNLGA